MKMEDPTSAKLQQSCLIKQKARELGFLDCGISKAAFLSEEKTHLEEWLQNGMHGEMSYMERNTGKRLDPRLLFDGAQSVISVLLNYFPSQKQIDPEAPVLSKYAYGKDYHFVLKKKLRCLLEYIQQEIAPCSARPFVDSAPVLDKAWAARAGLGWIGKNTNLIALAHGSFFFIGELIIDLPLEPDEKIVRNHCGNCTRCIDACPTHAIVQPYTVDARRCISYQTIELRGEMDASLQENFEGRVFGCDICQDVCPWNLKSHAHDEPDFEANSALMELSGSEWYEMDRPLFNELFRHSAVKRTTFGGLRRNLKFVYPGSSAEDVEL